MQAGGWHVVKHHPWFAELDWPAVAAGRLLSPLRVPDSPDFLRRQRTAAAADVDFETAGPYTTPLYSSTCAVLSPFCHC